jgi:glycerate kinase
LCENIYDVRILIAPDKFKGSLSARDVAENIASGLRDVLPEAEIAIHPVADGGEGTASAIHRAAGGEWVNCATHDALSRPIDARYLWLPERATAVMEMSETAGMWRIASAERDLWKADTSGVGEMLDHASRHGATRIVIGLGGSATNDGGFGMARALGFQFLGNAGELEKTEDLLTLERVVRPQRTFPEIIAAVDVQNPLLGPRGATRTFGPQKGGTQEQLEMLEHALSRLAEIVARDLGSDFKATPGAGAAGGLGFGLLSFCGAAIRPGFDVVADLGGLNAEIEKADIVITGEGRLDEQTLEGKAPAGVARLARAAGKRVFAIVGSSGETPAVSALFESVLVLARPPITPEESVARAASLLQERARELAQMM